MSNLRDQPEPGSTKLQHSIRARWFGQPALTSASSADAQLLALGKPLALLAYLDCAFRCTASRESLISLLWSEDADSRGRQNLRQTLFYIKQRLGRDVIESDGDRLTLVADFGSDRTAFELAVERQQWNDAVAAYRGAFLVGFAAPGSSGMEQWISVERTRLQRLFLGAADALAKELLSIGHAREAISIARRARDEMRGEQIAWRILLEAHISAQDHLSAMAEANALEEQVSNDGDELEPATKALIKTAKGRNGASAHSATTTTNGNGDHARPAENASATLARDLIAREHEFSTIIESWDNVRNAKGGQWIHLEAPAGMGKSRLLSDIAARLRALRGGVVEVRASPGERDVSCAFAAHVAAALASRRGARGISEESASVIVALAPTASTYLRANTHDTAVGNDAMRRRALALGELLQCVAQENSIALLLDDLHWADAESRVVLDAVFPKAREAGLLLVTAGRSLGAHDFASAPDVSMRLRGFAAPEIAQLLTDVAVLPDEFWTTGLVERLLLTTAGSPLLVIESVQRAMDAGLLRLSDQKWACNDPIALERLLEQGSAIRYRVKQLDADASFLLTSLALAGIPIGEDVLGRISERRLQPAGLVAESSPVLSPSHDAKSVLGILEQRGMLRRRAAAWDVAHDEIGAAAIAVSDAATLQRAHESMAWALLANGDRAPETLVRALRHLVSASATVPQWLVRRVIVAARHRGDERVLPAIVTDVLRGVAGPTEVAAVVKMAPWRLRADRSVRAFAVAALLVTAIGLGAVANGMWRSGNNIANQPSVSVLLSLETDTTQLYRIDLSGRDWDVQKPLEAISVSAGRELIAPMELQHYAQSGVNVLGQRLMRRDFPKNLEVMIQEKNGERRRIASDTADDVQPMWSSDGESVLFTTRRWDSLDDHAEIGYWTPRDSSNVLRLTNSKFNKSLGTLSPDGLAFAYSEDGEESEGGRVCWRNVPNRVAGSGCKRPRTGRLTASFTPIWYAPDTVLVQLLQLHADSVQRRSLAKLSLVTGETATVVENALEYIVSKDGQWILSRHINASGINIIRARPTSRPDRVRLLVVQTTDRAAEIRAAVFQAPAIAVESNPTVTFLTPKIAVHADDDKSRFLRVTDSTRSSAVVVQLESRDTSVFVIDSAQHIQPRRVGASWVVAAIGGSSDSAWVVVDSSSTSQEIFREEWRDPLSKRWSLHGDPAPSIERFGPNSFALAPNGDGDYHSLVSSKILLDASHNGAGVEIELMSKFDSLKWQNISVSLDASVTDATVRRWTPGMDAPPASFESARRQVCTAAFPWVEGGDGVDRFVSQTGHAQQVVAVSKDLRSGRPYTIRLQIDTDGSCNVAINGKPLPKQPGRLERGGKYRVMLSGGSMWTDLRILRVTAWEGRRGGVKW